MNNEDTKRKKSEVFKNVSFDSEAIAVIPGISYFVMTRNIVLHDSYQTDKIVIEIEEWKQKVPGVCVKSFSRVLLSVVETSVVS